MTQWYYSEFGQTKGPVSLAQIVDKVLKQELELESYVTQGIDQPWKKIKEFPELMDKIHTPDSALPTNNDSAMEAFQKYLDGDTSHNVYFYIPISRLIKMSILTLGLYQMYWWYKQWYYWATKKKQAHRSFDREFGWMLAELMILEKIETDKELNAVMGADFNGTRLFWGWVLFGIMLYAFSYVLKLKGVFNTLFYFMSFSFGIAWLLPVQSYINRVNAKLGNKYEKPGTGHYICLVLGIIGWSLEIIHGIRYLLSIF